MPPRSVSKTLCVPWPFTVRNVVNYYQKTMVSRNIKSASIISASATMCMLWPSSVKNVVMIQRKHWFRKNINTVFIKMLWVPTVMNVVFFSIRIAMSVIIRGMVEFLWKCGVYQSASSFYWEKIWWMAILKNIKSGVNFLILPNQNIGHIFLLLGPVPKIFSYNIIWF